ncbi:hypothetical protein BN873_160045 [Candidatus Competibacter denitrificans Run_A_D11]|uniref:Uncharacterized protein n=1 Tax=Candidatus Competibacter denitrificans Run_A_D11 TaxID=1400863 RepID=W6M2A0_9GAMM|nr:hypothetical protein BN873_160045 [Candidatus Competibacter denitrificans Run_A_D11]
MLFRPIFIRVRPNFGPDWGNSSQNPSAPNEKSHSIITPASGYVGPAGGVVIGSMDTRAQKTAKNGRFLS